MCEPTKLQRNIEGFPFCWKCKKTEVKLNAMDSIYRLKCNECYKYIKEKWMLDWTRSRERELVGCEFCLDAYRFKKKSEVHKCPIVVAYQCRLFAYRLNSSKPLKVDFKVANSGLRTRKVQKPFECNICKKTFSQSHHLGNHLKTHTGERPFECEICRKTFSRPDRLRSHLRTHTGEKPYECNICKKGFSQAVHLRHHLKMHTGEKPFECHICKKAFTRSQVLKVHLITHIGEKRVQCKICNKEFTRLVDLNLHLMNHVPLNIRFNSGI